VKDTLVIVNPASAGGRTGRGWAETAARLRAAGLDFDVAMTSCRGEAIELARLGAAEGRALLVAAGGDGTISEVANGILAGGAAAGGPRLGVLPVGTGGDFRRTFGIPLDVGEAAAVLVRGRGRRIDAGRVACAGPGGETVVGHFVNIASAGIGAEVVRRVDEGGVVVNGEITFTLASVRTLLSWRNKPVRVVVDGEARELVAQQVVVANCEYFGGGMRVAPRAKPDDGMLDVVVAGDLSAWENVRGLSKIRKGTHLDAGNPKITHAFARRVEVSSPELVRVEADGELPGVLPAVFEIVPDALEVVVP
jgi:YegS/Rv2252/BmrU family lipid kinase